MEERVARDFFTVPTMQLAKKLLGCVLVRQLPGSVLAGSIIETEAYTEDDPAAHSFGGKRTKRNEVMFAEGGHLYVYTSYGIHQCMNIVSEHEGRGCAVLIRALKPIQGINILRKNRGNREDTNMTNGPGKVCQAFGITMEQNGMDITDTQSAIYIRAGNKTPNSIATERIGISKGKNRKWRFLAV